MKNLIFALLAILAPALSEARQGHDFTCRLETHPGLTVTLSAWNAPAPNLSRNKTLVVKEEDKVLMSQPAHETIFKVITPVREFVTFRASRGKLVNDSSLYFAESGEVHFSSASLGINSRCLPVL